MPVGKPLVDDDDDDSNSHEKGKTGACNNWNVERDERQGKTMRDDFE